MDETIDKLLHTREELILLIDNKDKLAIEVNEVIISGNEIGVHYSRLYIKGENKTTKSETVGLVTIPIDKLSNIGIYFEKEAEGYLKREGLLDMYNFVKGDTNE